MGRIKLGNTEYNFRRSNLDIILTTLDVIGLKPKGMKPTHIIRMSNLNWEEWKRVREDLTQMGLIFVESERDHRYKLTEKGVLALAAYRDLLVKFGVTILSL